MNNFEHPPIIVYVYASDNLRAGAGLFRRRAGGAAEEQLALDTHLQIQSWSEAYNSWLKSQEDDSWRARRSRMAVAEVVLVSGAR